MIPVRPGDENEELRYALRSIDAHLDHDTVWIAGHCPPWVRGVRHIPVAHDRRLDRWANSRANRRAAFAHPEMADRVALWNDDFYLLRPIAEIPVWNLGPLLDRYRPLPRPPAARQFMEGLAVTYAWLHARGHRTPLSFEAHVPLSVDRAGFLAALDHAETIPTAAPFVRSIYANLAGLVGDTVEDVKYANAAALPPANALFVSSDDTAFDVGLVGDIVRTALPEPSRYERVEVTV